MKELLPHIITFVSGFIIGTFTTYFGNRLIEKAKKNDLIKSRLKEFNKSKLKMPDLISEMKSDLTSPAGKSCREFFILPSKKVVFNFSGYAFFYYEDEHENLRSKIRILESSDFVYDIAKGQTPKYQFKEEFVELLLNNG